MAERKVKWDIVGSLVTLTNVTNTEEVVKFELKEILPAFESLNDVQKFLFIYGVKQNLSDKFAMEKKTSGKLKAAEKRWEELKEGKIKVEGKSTLVTKITAQANVVSLEGLLSKKLLAKAKGEEFSKEDQTKLDEFLLYITSK